MLSERPRHGAPRQRLDSEPGLAALLFLYQVVLEREIGWLEGVVHAKRPERLPVVLSRGEIAAEEIDFAGQQLTIRDGKGRRDRVTLLPASLQPALRAHLDRMREQRGSDLRTGAGFVQLPDALRVKYPSASREWPWQWVFPATRMYVDRVTAELILPRLGGRFRYAA